MIAKLTKELSAALHATSDKRLEVIDPETNCIYMLIDGETHRQAMEALQRQQDRDAIAEGLSQMESGQGKPLDVAFAEIRTRLAFPTLK